MKVLGLPIPKISSCILSKLLCLTLGNKNVRLLRLYFYLSATVLTRDSKKSNTQSTPKEEENSELMYYFLNFQALIEKP